MKNLFSTMANPGKYSPYASLVLLLLRVAAGSLMLTHGYGKLQMLLKGGPYEFPDPYGLGSAISLALAVFAEFLCAIFVIFGIFTRLSVIPLIITMMTAAIIIHSGDPIAKRELSILFGMIFLTLAFLGAGKYSIDGLIYKK